MDMKIYPCGCEAGPSEEVPNYCPEHGQPKELGGGLESEMEGLLSSDYRPASVIALDEIQKACGYYESSWEYAAQVTRDVLRACADRDKLCAENKRLRAALIKLRDCDWVITLPDRMDAVRDIAREALKEDQNANHP